MTDRKFGVKARLSQALQVTLNLVKNNTNNPKTLQPVLHVLKMYSNNGKYTHPTVKFFWHAQRIDRH